MTIKGRLPFGEAIDGNTVVDAYILKSLDNVTIVKIDDKITILNNFDITSSMEKR